MTDSFKRCAILVLLLFAAVSVSAQSGPTRPLVKGAVFGGGRMADVGKSTLVEVKECQAVGEVFGGNDIAGSVNATAANANGFSGAQVVLGGGSAGTPIIVGSVYGGGNGYYYYPNGVGNTVWQLSGDDTVAKTLAAGDVTGYWSNGSGDVVATISGTPSIPTVKYTRISVVSDRVYIDSLFGGAKNAIVSGPASPATTDTTTSIRISGGTVFSVFGGNNFGGFLAKNSTQHIVVGNTKALSPNSSVKLGGIHSTGLTHTGATIGDWAADADAHAICYLFGGGNKVPGQNVHIEVKGGQIDTCFGGGNSADVRSVRVDVNVTTPKYTLATSPYTDASLYAYSPTSSVFDIRCLFGGNNAAAMLGVPTLNLTKGGIHNVYGGGNRGVMNGSKTYTDNDGVTTATLSTEIVINSANIICDTIYGGGQSAGTAHDTYIEVADGAVGTIFGGTNIQGAIPTSAKSNVYVHGGDVYKAVYGGSNGFYLCLNSTNYTNEPAFPDKAYVEELSLQPTPEIYRTNVKVVGGQVHGNVYGGGNLVVVGNPSSSIDVSSDAASAGKVKVHIGSTATTSAIIGEGSSSTISKKGAVYGSGNFACVFGYADMKIDGTATIYGDVYGGNDKSGTVAGSRTVTREDCGMTTYSTTRTDGQTFDAGELLYSGLGSSMALTNENAATYVLLQGTPKIYGSVYGGGNGDYDYYHYNTETGAQEWYTTGHGETRDAVLKCSLPPYPNQSSAFVDVNLSDGGYASSLFAGGNGATVGTMGSTEKEKIIINGITVDGKYTWVWMNCTDEPTNAHIGTIFGGNNKVAMYGVPNLLLLKGKVGTVYGGGNEGAMKGNSNLGTAYALSTYVGLASSNFHVADNVYGGCNASDVLNEVYVHTTRGTVGGHIFGGNDAAGEVSKKTHVVIDGNNTNPPTIGGNIYGGGNGNYAYYYSTGTPGVPGTGSDSFTGTFFIADASSYSDALGKYTTVYYTDVKGRPYCDSTEVVIRGKLTLNGNVYGGGVSGDCGKTRVLIDAENGVFNGLIFGAGQGRTDNMGLKVYSTWTEYNAAVSGGGCTCKAPYYGVAQSSTRTGGAISYGPGNAMGNVLDTAFLTIRRFSSMGGGRKAIFGGGQSGNVGNVVVKYEATATSPIKALYLGCLASDVTGTTHGIIDAYEDPEETIIIDTIYGGNDFTGRVARTVLDVNSGRFTHVYGAGNGDYDYRTLLAAWTGPGGRLSSHSESFGSGCACADTVPYSMQVEVNYNGGYYYNTVYGGGNMGLVGNRDMNPDAISASDVGSITVNIHGGEFHRHVFAGARGKTGMKNRFFGLEGRNNVDGAELGSQLAYAFKVLNMDGGIVHFSVYGGSEAVDDGFPVECRGIAYDHDTWYNNTITGGHSSVYDANTTRRPSQVLNIVGGDIIKSVYGGGYQGNIYGSVYVNIGADAVNDSPVWTRTYGGTSVASFKPNLSWATREHGTITGNPTLTIGNDIVLEASIYAAADWGEAGANSYFNTRGVFGGVTEILIDGKGYNTSRTNTETMTLPSMDISYSIIGAGTSTEGGDINRLITLRNYGDYVCPDPSKVLFSIQRADKVILDRVYVTLTGEQDAFMAYATPSYALCRIDTLIFAVDNIVMLQAPGIYIGNVASMNTNSQGYQITNSTYLYDKEPVADVEGSTVANDFHDNLHNMLSSGQTCSDNPNNCENLSFCEKLPTLRGASGMLAARNSLVFQNGSYLKVSPFVDRGGDGLDDLHDFGHIYGWMYMMAQDNTMSYVYAIDKITGESPVNANDGGFVAPCDCDNSLGSFPNEIDYTNVTAVTYPYRTWKVGSRQGLRTRKITLVANAIPDDILNYSLPATTYSTSTDGGQWGATSTTVSSANYGYAYATLELPPADGGNFYVINSVVIDQDNGGQISLIDEGYDYASNSIFHADQASSTMAAMSESESTRNYTFGLAMSTVRTGSNFESEGFSQSTPTTCWNTSSSLSNVSTAAGFSRDLSNGSTRYPCWPVSIVSGNSYLTTAAGFISSAVTTGSGVIPSIMFTLTYDKRITKTIQRDVVFTMYEFDNAGNFIGPVEVTVTISTVIQNFSNIEAPLLAMYNEGTSSQYVRKVSMPAAFLQRDLYLESVTWEKTTESGTDTWFYMQDTAASIDYNSQFSIVVKPTESTTENIVNRLGWYNIEAGSLDVYDIARNDYRATVDDENYEFTLAQKANYSSLNYDGASGKTNLYSNKKLIGTLDGRGTASIDVALNFDGDRVYHEQFSPPLATLTLTFYWKNTKTSGDGRFNLIIYLRTRQAGDTIYMAPDEDLERTTDGGCSVRVRSFAQYLTEGGDHSPDGVSIRANASYIRNNPDCYMTNFRDAMEVYQEGDVISIMKTITINDYNHPISVIGDDYSIIQVIRYSGNHYKFPSLGCANRDAMLEVTGSGVLTMRNVWLNGSGCTRTKAATEMTYSTQGSFLSPGDVIGNYNDFHATYGDSIKCGTKIYYYSYPRVNELLYVNAPIIYIHQHGSVNFSANVRLSNNFNIAPMDSTDAYPGGAIALVKDLSSGTPSLIIGTRGNIFDNLVLDHVAQYAPAATTKRNYGGGIYVDGGKLTLGTGGNKTEIHIARNFYLKGLNSSNAGIREKIKKDLDGTNKEFNIYYLDTCRRGKFYSLSNVYLTRTKGASPRTVRRDTKSDVVFFLNDFTEGSSVGISKWFPGYLYDNTGHPLDNDVARDTVTVVRLGSGKSNAALVDRVFATGVFFNDSAYFSPTATIDECPDDPDPTFKTSHNYTTYHSNSTGNPGYKDRVYVFHHSYVNQYNIYFQRCASFGKGVTQEPDDIVEGGVTLHFNKYTPGDSLAFRWNDKATCVSSTDSIFFYAGGGFFPYTYTWYYDSITALNTESFSGKLEMKRVKIRERQTYGTNNISDMSSSYYQELRKKAQVDTLVLNDLRQHQHVLKSTYMYTVTANDLTGNCPLVQPVMVRVGKITSSGRGHSGQYYIDSTNFLRHRNPYAAYYNYTPDGNNPGLYTDFPTATDAEHDSTHICYSDPSLVDLDDNPIPNNRLFHQKRDASNNLLYYDNDGNETTDGSGANAGRPVSDYLYYRVVAPGVDSSSFHDHTDTVHSSEGYGGYFFLNASGALTETSIGSDDTMHYSNGNPNWHVPHHTYMPDNESGAYGGIRRAGYSHLPMMWFRGGHNVGTRLQRKAANGFFGKPYHDAVAVTSEGTGDILFVNTTDEIKQLNAPEASWESDLYSSEMVPRYLRVYRSYKLNPSISPTSAAGEVWAFESTETDFSEANKLNLATTEFCPGGIVHLRPQVDASNWEYMAWDFDPSSEETTNFVVSDNDTLNNTVVYYAPKTYWWQHVTTQPAGYQVAYNGDVTITTREGLAWLISTVNGYNNQNAQTFHFNTIKLDFEHQDTVDMSKYRWTPIGTQTTPFEGVFTSRGSNIQGIDEIIVSEKSLPFVGLFGYTNGATISNIKLDTLVARGNNYVGGLVARANNTHIDNITLHRVTLFGEHVMGGIVADGEGTRINNVTLDSLFLKGNAIYAGSVVGSGSHDTIGNNTGYVETRYLSAVYFGGAMGHAEGVNMKTNGFSVLNNNYFHIVGNGGHQRMGGLVGSAEAITMNNNYVYGDIGGSDYAGGLVGYLGDNVSISNCYYREGMTENMIGYNEYGIQPTKSTTFSGKGNHVTLTQYVGGYNNMTRALNKWVDAQNDGIDYFHWRSDMENENNGFPVFGDPDIIPVFDTLETASCESFEFDGLTFDQSGIYVFRVIDSTEYVDSTLTLMLTINYGDTVYVSDTVTIGESYEGYGFSISSEEIKDEMNHTGVFDIRTMQRIDSLYNTNGCDSVIILTLYVLGNGQGTAEIQKLSEVKVYPNPTRGLVYVEGSDLESIEVYDNVSRRVLSRKVEGNRTTFDLSYQAAGSYYIRVRTASGSVVKKIVKK